MPSQSSSEPWPVPDPPGERLTDPAIHHFLLARVAELCGLSRAKFPGSQPVSFNVSSIEEKLMKYDFWTCEKSDGQRLLIVIVVNSATEEQETWLLDRKEQFYKVSGLHFPYWESPDLPLRDTIIDGELVIDEDPKTKERTLRYYAFDCLVVNGMNVTGRPLLKRFGRLREWVVAPFERILKQIPEWRDELPFEVIVKKQELSYHIAQVLNVHIPSLLHGHDGIIFTNAESPYVFGTDENILKWKKPSENTIDFKLNLRFPPSPADPSEPDFYAKPVFLLSVWHGGSRGQDKYQFFDELEVDDDEWEKFKEMGQIDDTIVECFWDTERGAWRYFRHRNDKENGNHASVVQKVLASIEDGVEIETLLSKSDAIRAAWKAREQSRRGEQTPAPPQHRSSAPQQGPRGSVPPITPGPGAYPATTPGVMAGLRR
ncbi:hypothetical protein BD324DRAFT_227683 [Kockovaella imperatae]|uniref:mRNA-capping enzyme subunit alpha n=1 Tax=Kockovaella imperatae TaxID=4999 RepID=A0A1Y1UNR6_9TREE|nr:hypothetical protein BD324DRAFT_227683 [Kockovaella imperatae]ORX39688.1 hypothetical protein BD324DRAFT_227683 [Kockovaella imperatae]